MTILQAINWVFSHHENVLIYFAMVPLATFVLGLFHRTSRQLNFIDFFFSILIYLSSIPGMLAAILLFYSALILRQNILNLNVIIYFLPLVSMASVYYLVSRKTSFARLPGFDRISGLMTLLALVCLIMFVLFRLHFFVGFMASLNSLIILAAMLFFMLKGASQKIFRR
jgi:hypothetical protein